MLTKEVAAHGNALAILLAHPAQTHSRRHFLDLQMLWACFGLCQERFGILVYAHLVLDALLLCSDDAQATQLSAMYTALKAASHLPLHISLREIIKILRRAALLRAARQDNKAGLAEAALSLLIHKVPPQHQQALVSALRGVKGWQHLPDASAVQYSIEVGRPLSLAGVMGKAGKVQFTMHLGADTRVAAELPAAEDAQAVLDSITEPTLRQAVVQVSMHGHALFCHCWALPVVSCQS